MRGKRVGNNSDGILAFFRYRRKWKWITSILSIFVIIGTVSSLMLPAVTLNQAACGQDEHIHSTECYLVSAERTLVCAFDAESDLACVVHTHDSICYDETGVLLCTLREVLEHRHEEGCYQTAEIVIDEGHIHGDNCYTWITGETPICGTEEASGHQHGDGCYAVGTELICAEEESAGHIHREECYTMADTLVCGHEECAGHTHSTNCYGEDGTIACGQEEGAGHTHEPGCYTQASMLICVLEEHTGHQHGDGCYAEVGTLLCTAEESDGHQHTGACYGQVKGELICTGEEREPVTEPGEPALICGQEEVVLHTHKGTCYEYDEEGNVTGLVCQEPEVLEHQHTDTCFAEQEVKTLVCDLPEHSHTDECRESTGLTDEEQAQVDTVILTIDALPTLEDVNTQFAAFDEAGDTAGREAYIAALTEQVIPAFAQYDALTEEQKAAVTNAPKLMALKYLLPEEETAPVLTEEEQTLVQAMYVLIEQLSTPESLEQQLAVMEAEQQRETLIGYYMQLRHIQEEYTALNEKVQAEVTNSNLLTIWEVFLEGKGITLTLEQQDQVDTLLALLTLLPTAQEAQETVALLTEAGELEKLDAFMTQLQIQTAEALSMYEPMTDLQKVLVSDAEKLTALVELLTPEPEILEIQGYLSITVKIPKEQDQVLLTEDDTFSFLVMINNEPASNMSFQDACAEETLITADENGILSLKPGQTLRTVNPLDEGISFFVQAQEKENWTWMSIEGADGENTVLTVENNAVNGQMQTNKNVQVTAVAALQRFTVSIPLTMQFAVDDPALAELTRTATFQIRQVQDAQGTPLEEGMATLPAEIQDLTLECVGRELTEGNILLEYTALVPDGDYFYAIEKRKDTEAEEQRIQDGRCYVAQVTVENGVPVLTALYLDGAELDGEAAAFTDQIYVVKLPNTGGAGGWIYLLTGSGLMTTSALAYGSSRKKRRGKNHLPLLNRNNTKQQ